MTADEVTAELTYARGLRVQGSEGARAAWHIEQIIEKFGNTLAAKDERIRELELTVAELRTPPVVALERE